MRINRSCFQLYNRAPVLIKNNYSEMFVTNWNSRVWTDREASHELVYLEQPVLLEPKRCLRSLGTALKAVLWPHMKGKTVASDLAGMMKAALCIVWEIKIINKQEEIQLVQSSAGYWAGRELPDRNLRDNKSLQERVYFVVLFEVLNWRYSLFITVPGVFSVYWTGPLLSAESPLSSSFCSTSCHTGDKHTGL